MDPRQSRPSEPPDAAKAREARAPPWRRRPRRGAERGLRRHRRGIRWMMPEPIPGRPDRARGPAPPVTGVKTAEVGTQASRDAGRSGPGGPARGARRKEDDARCPWAEGGQDEGRGDGGRCPRAERGRGGVAHHNRPGKRRVPHCQTWVCESQTTRSGRPE